MSAIEELAKRCGIAQAAINARGKTTSTPLESNLSLLAAMGLNISDEQSAQIALQHLDSLEWDRPLPPVVVSTGGGDSLSIPLVMLADSGPVAWSISTEGGAEIRGQIPFTDMTLLEERKHQGKTLQRRILNIMADIPHGYHTLHLDKLDHSMPLIVAPPKCWLPEALENGQRIWGVAVQLYLQRSEHNWGIGDLGDLRQIVQMFSRAGADVVGINPLHAMFADRPEDASPYSPSDRNLLNVLNIDVEAVAEYVQSADVQELVASEDFQTMLARCRSASYVAYTDVANCKIKVLKLMFQAFDAEPYSDRQRDFKAFCAERSSLLERSCTFQALRAFLVSRSPGMSECEQWPDEYRTYRSQGVAHFVKEHSYLIRFEKWLQWIADTQLAAAADAAKDMLLGIYRDVAVGTHTCGAEVWAYSDVAASGVHVGAPPDIWNAAGQDWGLPPMHPNSLRQSGYRSFIELLQSNMRHAGALRIDHAMALDRLYWIPKNHDPSQGAYVSYPIEDLLGILALESHRNKCLVIGEDLGTVPAGFRERMAEANVLSYRVLFFERDDGGFVPPNLYPPLSVSVASSHDLPTLYGWWYEADIHAKEKLNLFAVPEEAAEMRAKRQSDRQDLTAQLHDKNLVDKDNTDPSKFSEAAHQFLARTRSMLTLIQMDDLVGELEQVNIPSTSNENPNWRRRQSRSIEEFQSDTTLNRLQDAMKRERGGSS